MSKRKKIVLIAAPAAVLAALVITFFTTGIWEFLWYKYDMQHFPMIDSLKTLAPYEDIPVDSISDKIPVWIDEALTISSYITEEEFHPQSVIDEVFAMIADEAEDSPAGILKGHIKDEVVSALFVLPRAVMGSEQIIADSEDSSTFGQNISVAANKHNIYFSGTIGDRCAYIISYSSDGSVTKALSYYRNKVAYVVTNINNERLQKTNSSKHIFVKNGTDMPPIIVVLIIAISLVWIALVVRLFTSRT